MFKFISHARQKFDLAIDPEARLTYAVKFANSLNICWSAISCLGYFCKMREKFAWCVTCPKLGPASSAIFTTFLFTSPICKCATWLCYFQKTNACVSHLKKSACQHPLFSETLATHTFPHCRDDIMDSPNTIYYIGFYGVSTKVLWCAFVTFNFRYTKRYRHCSRCTLTAPSQMKPIRAVEAVYESRPMPKDHNVKEDVANAYMK